MTEQESEWQKLASAFRKVMNWLQSCKEWAESVNCLTKLLAGLFSSPKRHFRSIQEGFADSFNAWEDLPWTKENALVLVDKCDGIDWASK